MANRVTPEIRRLLRERRIIRIKSDRELVLKEIKGAEYDLEKAKRSIDRLPVLNFTKRDANLSAKIELEAESMGTPIRRTDATIAAITLNNGASLYTLDLKHFQPLKALGLKLFPPSCEGHL